MTCGLVAIKIAVGKSDASQPIADSDIPAHGTAVDDLGDFQMRQQVRDVQRVDVAAAGKVVILVQPLPIDIELGEHGLVQMLA